jgi:hypothetical protein
MDTHKNAPLTPKDPAQCSCAFCGELAVSSREAYRHLNLARPLRNLAIGRAFIVHFIDQRRNTCDPRFSSRSPPSR